MLRFKAGDRHSPIAGSNVESPYNLSPIGQDAHGLLSPKMSQRKIARSPFKVGVAWASFPPSRRGGGGH